MSLIISLELFREFMTSGHQSLSAIEKHDWLEESEDVPESAD